MRTILGPFELQPAAKGSVRPIATISKGVYAVFIRQAARPRLVMDSYEERMKSSRTNRIRPMHRFYTSRAAKCAVFSRIPAQFFWQFWRGYLPVDVKEPWSNTENADSHRCSHSCT